MVKDHCISCGAETPYDFETHIDMRIGYIEGTGQLCSKCYNQDNKHNYITVPKSLIKNTPNDQKLGGEVRSIYWDSLK
jgi:hypothetical protein